jgi:hypothetical protein
MGTVAADVPGFRKFKDSFRPESEKDPNAGGCVRRVGGAAPAWCLCAGATLPAVCV